MSAAIFCSDPFCQCCAAAAPLLRELNAYRRAMHLPQLVPCVRSSEQILQQRAPDSAAQSPTTVAPSCLQMLPPEILDRVVNFVPAADILALAFSMQHFWRTLSDVVRACKAISHAFHLRRCDVWPVLKMPHEYEIKNGQMLQKPKNISMRTAARYIEFVYHLDKYGGSASYSGLYGAEWMCEFAPFLPKRVDLEVFDGRVLDEISSDICFTKLCIACATMDGFSFRSLSGRRVQHLEMNYIGLDDFAHLISINGLKKLTLRMDEDFVGIPLEILLLEVKSLQILHFRDPPFWLTRQLVENFSVLNKTKLREIELSGFSFSVLNPFAVDQHFVNWELNVADDNDEWKLTWKPS